MLSFSFLFKFHIKSYQFLITSDASALDCSIQMILKNKLRLNTILKRILRPCSLTYSHHYFDAKI